MKKILLIIRQELITTFSRPSFLFVAVGIPLLSSSYSMFVSCGRLHAAGLTGLDGAR